MAHATKPSRSSGSLTIAFGLVSVPVQVYGGTVEAKTSRNRFSPAGNPVSMKNVDSVTGTEVEYSQFQMMATATDGSKVELTNEEIEKVVGAQNGHCEVIAFVPAEEARATYVARDTFQVRPARGSNKKPSPAFDKAFALLTQAMVTTGTVAVVKFALRGKPRYGYITPTGNLVVCYFENEVREELPAPAAELSDQELAMAGMLVESMKMDSAPAIFDEAADTVQAYVDAKAAGTPQEEKEAVATPAADDLMAALKASIATAKG